MLVEKSKLLKKVEVLPSKYTVELSYDPRHLPFAIPTASMIACTEVCSYPREKKNSWAVARI
jgi:hypothetical protein